MYDRFQLFRSLGANWISNVPLRLKGEISPLQKQIWAGSSLVQLAKPGLYASWILRFFVFWRFVEAFWIASMSYALTFTLDWKLQKSLSSKKFMVKFLHKSPFAAKRFKKMTSRQNECSENDSNHHRLSGSSDELVMVESTTLLF